MQFTHSKIETLLADEFTQQRINNAIGKQPKRDVAKMANIPYRLLVEYLQKAEIDRLVCKNCGSWFIRRRANIKEGKGMCTPCAQEDNKNRHNTCDFGNWLDRLYASPQMGYGVIKDKGHSDPEKTDIPLSFLKKTSYSRKEKSQIKLLFEGICEEKIIEFLGTGYYYPLSQKELDVAASFLGKDSIYDKEYMQYPLASALRYLLFMAIDFYKTPNPAPWMKRKR